MKSETKWEDRAPNGSDALRYLSEIAKAISLPMPASVRDCDTVIQELMFILDRAQKSNRHIEEQLQRMKAALPLSYVNLLSELKSQILDIEKDDPPEAENLLHLLESVQKHLAYLAAREHSFYDPDKYILRYFKKGLLQKRSLNLFDVERKDDGAILLSVNDSE